ncbi:PTS fructose transporter subunit IIABC [Tomitella biformata]|uniref:PTS fructose transporter subunit IIABC n=1 Tax=Tomitella biformata TaxID=630403 RepID=UPI000465B2C5|nr:fructose-specific PTS transporter subunit EIIC [Tomitella biformata]
MTETPSGAEPAIISPELVSLDISLGETPAEVIRALAARLAEHGRADDADQLAAAALEREAKSATGLPGGIAIPHCRSRAVRTASLGFARLRPAVDFGAPDAPADIVFLIAAPESGGAEHMKLLSSLARALVRPAFVASLREATSAQEIVALVTEVLNPAPAAAATAAPVAPPTPEATRPRVVAITACPTGIAHTYMAADALTAAAERADIDLHVETQGSSGTTALSKEVIAGADAVIFATDVGVKGRERFAGKPVIASGVKRAINEPDKMLAEAVAAASNPHAATVHGGGGAQPDQEESGQLGLGSKIKQVLLTGVSYMIPFVAAGGLLIALGFLIGGYQISEHAQDIVLNNSLANMPDGGLRIYLGSVLFTLGSVAFGFLVPALAGYIAFGIADRPGIAPGFTVGAIAVLTGAGFIGGLVGGLVAGLVALWISRWPVPDFVRGLMPVAIIPLLATIVSGGLMLLVLGRPLAAATSGMENFLNGLTGTSAALLGILLGLMMCFDLGGPVNKAAYAFAVAGLSVTDIGSLKIMAAVMAAGMVPPLAMALASAVRPKLFSPAERENGKAAWLLGASFISEGAIPFAAADPLRVIPSMMFGGAITGALTMMLGVTLKAPHGGIFVLFAVGNILGFVIALAAGTIASAAAVIAAKQFIHKQSHDAPADSAALAA